MNAAIVVAGVLSLVGCLVFNYSQPDEKRATGGVLLVGTLGFTGMMCTVVAILLLMVGVK